MGNLRLPAAISLSLPPLSLFSPSFSLSGAELNFFFFTFSQHIQDISKPTPKSPLLPDEVLHLINSLFCVSPVDFGGEGVVGGFRISHLGSDYTCMGIGWGFNSLY